MTAKPRSWREPPRLFTRANLDLATLSSSAVIGSGKRGLDHRFTFLAGNSPEEMQPSPALHVVIGKTRWELAGSDPDSDEPWRQHKADLEAPRTFRQFCYAVIGSSGSEYFLSVNGKTLFNDNGEFLGYRGSASNITEVVAARRRAATADALLQDAVDSIADGFVIYDSRRPLCYVQRRLPAFASPRKRAAGSGNQVRGCASRQCSARPVP